MMEVIDSAAVVIPCYNHAIYLRRAVASALSQTLPAKEIIVVDDGSEDDILAALEPYRAVRLVRQSNRGLAAARNAGLRVATSSRIIFLDADDYLHPKAIEAGLSCFEQHPAAAFVYGGYEIQTKSTRTYRYHPLNERSDLIRFNWIGMIATVMFARDALLSVGGFDENLGMAEDWDTYLRLTREYAFATHPETVATYVQHGGNMSSDALQLRRWIDVIRERERLRGLRPDELRAWRAGEYAWDYLYATEPIARRLARKIWRSFRLLK